MILTLLNSLLRSPRFFGSASLLLVIGMLAACWWPFRAPKNSVSWVSGRHAVDFGHYGVLLGSHSLTAPGDRDAAHCSIELWLRPDPIRDMGVILGVYSAERPRQFSIEQWHTGLALRSATASAPIRTGSAPSYADEAFAGDNSVFVTITSDERGTEVYVDGSLRRVTPAFRITNKMLTGNLIAGSGATNDDGWPGQLRGLAIYARVLSAEEVQRHFALWTGTGGPSSGELENPLALYLFAEGKGDRVRDEAAGGVDLLMPEHYVVPAKRTLAPVSLDNREDIIANIIGFLPLGFTLCGYLVSSRQMRMAVVVTTIICGVFSLLIESVQTFLPTRDSSMTDVITNVIGGWIGALMYRWGARG
jgi:VanZ like family/Concanavalin A-like lectin/glucanases superfamily